MPHWSKTSKRNISRGLVGSSDLPDERPVAQAIAIEFENHKKTSWDDLIAAPLTRWVRAHPFQTDYGVSQRPVSASLSFPELALERSREAVRAGLVASLRARETELSLVARIALTEREIERLKTRMIELETALEWVADLATGVPVKADPVVDWIAEHPDQLSRYRGKHVALTSAGIVAHADTLDELIRQTKDRDDRAAITYDFVPQ